MDFGHPALANLTETQMDWRTSANPSDPRESADDELTHGTTVALASLWANATTVATPNDRVSSFIVAALEHATTAQYVLWVVAAGNQGMQLSGDGSHLCEVATDNLVYVATLESGQLAVSVVGGSDDECVDVAVGREDLVGGGPAVDYPDDVAARFGIEPTPPPRRNRRPRRPAAS